VVGPTITLEPPCFPASGEPTLSVDVVGMPETDTAPG